MADFSWHDVSKVAPADLVDARLQAHFAAEWVSRVGRFIAEPQPDYSQIALRWDTDLNGLKTQTMHTKDGDPLIIGLKLAPLEVVVLQSAKIKSNIPLNDVTHQQLGTWLENELLQVGLPGERIADDIPYKLHHERLSNAGRYEINAANLTQFQTLQAWFANANTAINAEAQKWQHIKPGASAVLCWPHHFDSASLIALDEGEAEQARSVGIGMSPGDETYSAPYFYINPWPRTADSTLPKPPDGAFWHTEHFFSLIMPASELINGNSAKLSTFITQGVQQAMQVINYNPQK